MPSARAVVACAPTVEMAREGGAVSLFSTKTGLLMTAWNLISGRGVQLLPIITRTRDGATAFPSVRIDGYVTCF